MKLQDFFASLADKAGRKLDTLADEQLANHGRKKSLNRIEQRFEEMAADGLITEEEMEELVAQMRSEGLDPNALEHLFHSIKGQDASLRDGETDAFEELFDGIIDRAEDEVDDSQSDLMLQIQLLSGDYQNHLQAASKVSKAEHDALMAVIGNMKA